MRSSLSMGVGNRGVTTTPAIQSVSAAASGGNRRLAPGSDVGEEAVRHGGVGPLTPAPDDATVDPDGRADVAAVVEQGGDVLGIEVPVTGLPAHRGRVQRRQERHPRLRGDDRVEIVGQDPPLPLGQVDGHRVDCSQCRPRRRERPARPPLEVSERRRAEGPEPAPHQLGSGHLRVVVGEGLTEPVLGADPAVLARDPRAAGPAPDDPALHRQQAQHPGRHPDLGRPLGTGPRRDLQAELGHMGVELGRGRRTVLGQRGHGGVLHRGEPPIGATAAGDSGCLDHPDQPLALRPGQITRATDIDQAGQLPVDDEHGPTHPHQAHQGPVLVEGLVELGDRGVGTPRPGGEDDGRRIAGVHAREVHSYSFDRRRRSTQVVTATEPGPPLGIVEATAHAAQSGCRASWNSRRVLP